jgi:hypothetical protein
MPSNFKPILSVVAGAYEIRIQMQGEWPSKRDGPATISAVVNTRFFFVIISGQDSTLGKETACSRY